MKKEFGPNFLTAPELAEAASQFKQLKFRNLNSDVFQRQDILSPYILISQRFHTERMIGIVEIFDGESCQHHVLTKREYELFQRRPLHSHGYLELMVVVSGAVLNHVEGESFAYRAGQGCIMNTNIRHREEPIGETELLFVGLRHVFLRELLSSMSAEKAAFKGATLTAFLQDVLDEETAGAFHKQYLDFSPSGNEELIRPAQKLLCVDALQALREKRPGCSYLIRAAILGYLNDLGNASLYTLQSVSSAVDHKDFLVSKIDLLIQASHGKVRKQELQEQLSYNGDYLNRLYKQQKGQSISDACREVMIRDTKHYLTHTSVTIDEIMQTLQITSRGYFYALFQQETGMTPKEYRVREQGK